MSSGKQPQNLWPKFRSNLDELKSPLSIVKEQASQLAPQTQGLVVAKVIMDPDSRSRRDDDPVYTFILTCPPLGNYSVHLFEMRTMLTALYPIRMYSYFLKDEHGDGLQAEINNEAELYEVLSHFLAHTQTVNAIEAMLAHAGGELKKKKKGSEDETPIF